MEDFQDVSEEEFLNHLNTILPPSELAANAAHTDTTENPSFMTGEAKGRKRKPIPTPAPTPAYKKEKKNENENENTIQPRNQLDQGKIVYEDYNFIFRLQQVAHQRMSRFALNDHLYNIKIISKRRHFPLLSSIEKGLKISLIAALENLKSLYNKDNHHQIYVTVIERQILRGLNSGNYDINTPSVIIANRVLSMLYNYLKSYQTLRINDSFKIQIKVLSTEHNAALRRSKRINYRQHIYHTQNV